MLTVWCVLWGRKYHPAYVYALEEAVRDHLHLPYRFRCVTSQALAGIDTVAPPRDLPTWWSKLNLFGLADGPSLYFDLDVVIVGSLDYLEEYTRFELAAPANWGQSGHGGIQSSVMAWSGEWRAPFDRVTDSDIARLWGDQEYLTELRGAAFVPIPGIYSYKYHCRSSPPGDAAVVVFHGKPDPHEVDGWTLPFTRTLRSRIKLPTPSTCAGASPGTG